MLGLPYNISVKIEVLILVTTQKNLTSGLEDYIEAIYVAHINKKPLKGAELARQLNISRASVSEALSKLVEKKLINYNSYEAISITDKGIEEAVKVYEKHRILKDFFENILKTEKTEASENACRMEHIISQDILDRMSKFTTSYLKNKEKIERLMCEN